MNNRNNIKFVLAASTLMSPLMTAPAFAQEGVADIVVTAQKREEPYRKCRSLLRR